MRGKIILFEEQTETNLWDKLKVKSRKKSLTLNKQYIKRRKINLLTI